MLRLNKSLVRPHVDYCLSAWSPHYVKDKIQVEKVLRRFTKMIPEMQNHSYEARLKKLHLWSLEERRNRSDIIEVFTMFKCISGIYRLKRFSNLTTIIELEVIQQKSRKTGAEPIYHYR